MILLLDTSARDITQIDAYTDHWESFSLERAHSGAILAAMEQVRSRAGQQLTGLAAVVGHGSFTATRVAVTIANTLAYAWGIPVVAVTNANHEQALALLQQARPGVLIAAEYSAPPRVGT